MKTLLLRPFRSLTFAVKLAGTTTLPLLVVAPSVALVGCADEQDPATWVKRLEDPIQRNRAVTRLADFFEGGMTKANQDRQNKDMVKLLDTIVDPLSKQYAAGGLDDKLRRELIKSLSDMRDPRAMPAFAKALSSYEPEKNMEEDVRWASHAVSLLAKEGKVTDQSVIDALWDCFSKYKPSKTTVQEPMKELQAAVLAVKHASYGPKAVDKLSAVIRDRTDVVEQKDQLMHWQSTSLRLLGELKFAPGARAATAVLLNKQKADLKGIATSVLMQMPKEGEAALIGAISGSDAELKKLGESEFGAGAQYLAVVADVLGYISRPAGQAATVAALHAATTDEQRTVMAQSLTRYEATPAGTQEILAAYGKIAETTEIELIGGSDGRTAIVNALPNLFDTALVPWLLKEIATTKAAKPEVFRQIALSSAIRLMTAAQAKDVGDAVTKYGTAREKGLFESSNAALVKCKEDAACYVSVLDEPIPSTPDTARAKHAKAVWMAAIYGNPKTKDDVLARVEKITDPAVRLAMVEALSHLAPKGDDAAANKLDAIAKSDVASGNGALKDVADALVKIARRLRARALP
jgi:hypothetical protein